MRYVVVGTSGSGKSTFARQLAAKTGGQYIELDALYWRPGWSFPSLQEFQMAVAQATQGERWVVDGNYHVVRDIIWPRATHVIWLNFSRLLVFSRVIRRTLWRGMWREELWAGNRESLVKALFSKDSILLWSFTTYRKNQETYAKLRACRAYAQLQWHEMHTGRRGPTFMTEARPGSTPYVNASARNSMQLGVRVNRALNTFVRSGFFADAWR